LLALSIAPAIALAGPTRTAANSVVFQDSVGEDAQAPDITSITVSNDDTGKITFQLAVANRPALTPDMLYLIFLDTDSNAATGDTESFGAEYVIQLVPGEVDLFKWNGTDYVGAPSPSLNFSYPATGPVVNVNASDLGKTKAFNFVALAISGITTDAQGNPDFTNIHRDLAPDPGHGAFAYPVNVKVTLTVSAFTTSPKPVKAGKAFSVGLAADESDTGGPVEQGKVTCIATIAGKRVRLRSSRLVNGIGVCIWSIPKTAKGKRVKGTISVAAQGATVSRAFSLKIA
jgi:hypothetical protein